MKTNIAEAAELALTEINHAEPSATPPWLGMELAF